uniref:HECT-type E3 ubiquitin transferase n=1 Tax=Glossina brevipalpis TaxID=37001 RepID=A0A1A9X5D6_9MUSC
MNPASTSKPGSQVLSSFNSRNLRRSVSPNRHRFIIRRFYSNLTRRGYAQGPAYLRVSIRRSHVLDDSFRRIMAASKKKLRRSHLIVNFVSEQGMDFGGLTREFFSSISRKLFDPCFGLFEYSADDTHKIQMSPLSASVTNFEGWFQFVGRIFGLALINRCQLEAPLVGHFYKILLRLPMTLSDLESFDDEFFQSLEWIRDNDLSAFPDLDLTFCVTENVLGDIVERDLKADGRNIAVNEMNKLEFLSLMIKWRLGRGVQQQTECLLRGFYQVIDSRLMKSFTALTLQLVIAGTPEIDINNWRCFTEYRGGYDNNHQVIVWFWETVTKFTNEQRSRLLKFVTGTSSLPYEGFVALRNASRPTRFCIVKWNEPNALPCASTCTNRLLLPPYSTAEELYEKLLFAVEETDTFGRI